jgi:predicted nucleotidyltransferase
VEPFGDYDSLLPGSEIVDVAGLPIRTIGLDDLIAIKRHINRPKDRAALLQLEALKRLREE